MVPATNEAFREQHGDDYKEYVRNVFEETNGYLKETFEDEAPNPHIVITKNEDGEWGEWTNEGPEESTTADRVEMKQDLNWPTTSRYILDTENTNRRGADVLSGFSGRNMVGTSGQDEGFQDLLGDFADVTAAPSEKPDSAYDFAGGATLIGTRDTATVPFTETVNPPAYPPFEVTIPIQGEVPDDRFVDNYYLHELGHVLGAQHPGSDTNSPDVELGTPGVMCKYTCFPGVSGFYTLEDTILGNETFSSNNRERILNNNRDWYDNEFLEYGKKEPNIARNLSTVSKAATEGYWKNRDDVIGD